MERAGVVVDGWGPVAAEAAAQLRRCGVPVRAGGHGADAAELDLAAGLDPPAVLVLVAGGHGPGWWRVPSAAAPWQVRGVPLLPVTGRGDDVVVGPLVVSGRTPCLDCVTLPPTPSPLAHPDPATVVLAAAVATVTALGVLRGDLSLGAVSTDIGPAGATVVHRVWTSLPGCRCSSVRMAG